jgi:hypothetical protein
MPASKRTGVDELLLGNLPALVCLNLRFELANLLVMVLAGGCDSVCAVAVVRTVSDGSASMTNLFCLRSWARVSDSCSREDQELRRTLNVIFILAVLTGAGRQR